MAEGKINAVQQIGKQKAKTVTHPAAVLLLSKNITITTLYAQKVILSIALVHCLQAKTCNVINMALV